VSLPVQRRHRLSRSRDFDAVYRHGRSVSTRYLTLYSFAREASDEDAGDPRLGLAVSRKTGNAVTRNRIKRQLREAWTLLLDEVPAGHDYVLSVREGLPAAAEARGQEWLVERVQEALGKSRA
jgi:ribonuclease P protein component